MEGITAIVSARLSSVLCFGLMILDLNCLGTWMLFMFGKERERGLQP